MTYGYSKDGGRGEGLRRAAGGAGSADSALLGAAITAAVDDAPPRPGGVIDQFTQRATEMLDRAEASGLTHCAHWMEGDGACCRCDEPNWCPDGGETPAALEQFEQRKGCQAADA